MGSATFSLTLNRFIGRGCGLWIEVAYLFPQYCYYTHKVICRVEWAYFWSEFSCMIWGLSWGNLLFVPSVWLGHGVRLPTFGLTPIIRGKVVHFSHSLWYYLTDKPVGLPHWLKPRCYVNWLLSLAISLYGDYVWISPLEMRLSMFLVSYGKVHLDFNLSHSAVCLKLLLSPSLVISLPQWGVRSAK